MKFTDINFDQPSTITINGVEFTCSNNVSGENHVFNKSIIHYEHLYPAALITEDEIMDTLTTLPEYSLLIHKFGNEVFFKGVIKNYDIPYLNPTSPKFINATAVGFEEWLHHKTMDFPILNMQPEAVVDKIIKTLNIPDITKGYISFENIDVIDVYDTNNKTAYDVLKVVEKMTNSNLLIQNRKDGSLSIGFVSKKTIASDTHNHGLDIDMSTLSKYELAVQTHDIRDIKIKQNNAKTSNSVRIESENAMADKDRKIEIDLSIGTPSFTTNFKIGRLDSKKSKLIITDDKGKVTERRLFIVTQEEADAGKLHDVSWTPAESFINISDRLVGTTSKIIIWYYPILKLQLKFEDVNKIQEVAVRTDSNGVLQRREKHNDITSIPSLIRHGQKYLADGISDYRQIVMKSGKPLWEIGQSLNYKGYYGQLSGTYFVLDCNFQMILDDKGRLDFEFEYTLVLRQDWEVAINYFDSMTYRDNPIFNAEYTTFETKEDISGNFFLKFKNEIKACSTYDMTKEGLEIELESDLETEQSINGNLVIYN